MYFSQRSTSTLTRPYDIVAVYPKTEKLFHVSDPEYLLGWLFFLLCFFVFCSDFLIGSVLHNSEGDKNTPINYKLPKKLGRWSFPFVFLLPLEGCWSRWKGFDIESLTIKCKSIISKT